MKEIQAFPFRVRCLLEARGFSVISVRDSRSPIDLIVCKPNYICGYRCKGHGHISKSELTELQNFARKSGLRILIAKEHDGRGIYFQQLSACNTSSSISPDNGLTKAGGRIE